MNIIKNIFSKLGSKMELIEADLTLKTQKKWVDILVAILDRRGYTTKVTEVKKNEVYKVFIKNSGE